jgi:DNA-binding NtrC family response regulator
MSAGGETQMKAFLVVSREAEVFRALHSAFHSAYRVDKAENKDAALNMLGKQRYDLIFVDLLILRESMPDNKYKAALQPFWRIYSTVEVIVMSSPEMIREAVAAVKAGASNYLTYPISLEETTFVIESLHESILLQSELDYLRDRFWQVDSFEIIKTQSLAMREVFNKLRSVAPTRAIVLLTGETGTGKGLLARLIHQHSKRMDAQFISVHCGAIPDTLLESELFGHEKGAFTGAIKRKLGKFEIATGGTIFLDEIGTITPATQIKLLQILQDGIFQRVGGEKTIEADARVIAATNMDLKQMCEDGQFRRDLYYRLNVFPVEIPPLRQRIEDLSHIVEVILGRLNKVYLKQMRDVHPDVMKAFAEYTWPGNIRELENLLERGYILENSSVLTPESFPGDFFASGDFSTIFSPDSSLPLAEVRRKCIEDIESRYLKELLARNNGRIGESAEAAGITTRQLHKLLTRYGIKKEDFKSRASHQ